MVVVNIHEAKTNLSRLLKELDRHGEIVIARAGEPVARLVSYSREKKRRKLGSLAGKFEVPDDFDEELPPDVLGDFEGGRDAGSG